MIGSEFAGIYQAFVSEVTVVEALPRMMGTLDQEVVEVLKDQFVASGIRVLENTKVEEITQVGENLKVTMNGPQGVLSVVAEKVLLSIGRSPYTKGLGLETIDIVTDRGAIKVDPGPWKPL